MEVVANNVQLLGSGNQQGGSAPNDGAQGGYQNNYQNSYQSGGYQQNRPAQRAPQQAAPVADIGGPESFDDADIPF